MNNSTINNIIHKAGLQFDNRYLEHKSYFMSLHNSIPNINWISELNGEKAFNAFASQYADYIDQVHTYRWYKQHKKAYHFDRTIVRLKQAITLEFGNCYCEMLHNGQHDELIASFTTLFDGYRERQKREPREINLIVRGDSGLELKAMEIKRSKLDIDLYYEDDFKEVDKLVRKRLARKQDKGIILLHGLPGTGKTTYLRYLVGRLNKQVLFLSPSVAGDLMDPGFIQLLIDNANSVVIIEDAENILMDRRLGRSSPVSNLLNISDGLLADFLNVQLICTFNSALTLVDSALMRKGRLIAQYEFGKLSAGKAQRLSNHLGYQRLIEKPMTLAEIANQDEPAYEPKERVEMGFRRPLQPELV
jgi:hypothetical protein